MAEIARTKARDYFGRTYAWPATTENDTFQEVITNDFTATDQIFDFAGTFGGATVTIHGKVDADDTYAVVPDKEDSTAGITAAGRIIIADQYYSLKPVASGGSSQSLTASARFGRVVHN